MANIFQESLSEIKTTPFVSTAQEDRVTPALIETVGETARSIDIAREKNKMVGTPEDELPWKWAPEEMEGPSQQGEGAPVYRAVKTFDPDVELNLTQLVKAREQGIMSASEADARIKTALRTAINRRPGRYNELKSAADKFTNLYDGILDESEADRNQAQMAEWLEKQNWTSLKETGLTLEERIIFERGKTNREMQALQSANAAGQYPAELVKGRLTVIHNRMQQALSLPDAERVAELQRLQRDMNVWRQDDIGAIGGAFSDNTLRGEATTNYNKAMDDVAKQIGAPDYLETADAVNKLADAAGYKSLLTDIGPEAMQIHRAFGPDATQAIFSIIDEIGNIENNQALTDAMKAERYASVKKKGFYGRIAFNLKHLGKEAIVKDAAKETADGMRGINEKTIPDGWDLPKTQAFLQEFFKNKKDATSDQIQNALDMQMEVFLEDGRAITGALQPGAMKLIKASRPHLNKLANIVSTKFVQLSTQTDIQKALEARNAAQLGGDPSLYPQEPGTWREATQISIPASRQKLLDEWKAINEVAEAYNFTLPGMEEEPQAQKKSPMKSDVAVDFIKEAEGYRDTAYQDSAGVWTIGYGTTKGVKEGDTITKEEAEKRLSEDMQWARDAVTNNVSVPLTDAQAAALTSLIYNIGEGAFKKSKALELLNSGDYEGFSEEAFGDRGFVNAGGKRVQGLVNRRNRERELFERV